MQASARGSGGDSSRGLFPGEEPVPEALVGHGAEQEGLAFDLRVDGRRLERERDPEAEAGSGLGLDGDFAAVMVDEEVACHEGKSRSLGRARPMDQRVEDRENGFGRQAGAVVMDEEVHLAGLAAFVAQGGFEGD